MINIIIILFVISYSGLLSISDTDTVNTCKERLPNEINGYQPVLVPVLTPDGNRLYLDRKSHPANRNGVKDFDDIWYSDRLSSNSWTEPKNLLELNTPESDVLFWISPDERKGLVYGIYSDDYKNKKQGFSFSEFDGENWSKTLPLNIKDFYNDSLNFYATMSADENVLIIAVSRKDGFGGLDLYVSFLDEKKDEYSTPQNLGRDINTKFDDEAPFLAYDNKTLYFSSNGLKGEGEQDLYMTRRLDDSWKKWSKPVNLGKKINTKFGEHGICLNSLGDSAIIVSYDTVSKRKGLYSICLPREFQPEPYTILTGKIALENSVDSDNIVLIFVNDKPKQKINIGKLKNYAIVLADNIFYNIRFEAINCGIIEYELDLKNNKKSQIIKHDLIFHKQVISNKIPTIYFDYDSFDINNGNKKKLDELIPEKLHTGKIEIIGHTDTSGTEHYNFELSKKRANIVRDYLIRKGFNKNHIFISAKGEKEPISTDNSQNRRVVILIK